MLHRPNLRLTDIHTQVETGSDALRYEGEAPDRAILFYALDGDFRLELPGSANPPLTLVRGAAVGLQSGRKHRMTGIGSGPYELFVSSIQRQAALLQNLDGETILVPPASGSSSAIISHAVAIHLIEFRTRADNSDDVTIRRCAEIVMAELVRYARTTMVSTDAVPESIAHDEYLLRAWSAYYAAPRARWTVKALADAAGLSRTAFAERFRNATGVPPLTAISDLRLQHAVTMLCEERTPLIEVAFTAGYNSEAAFVRAFSRKFGVPPGRYRQQLARSAA